MDWTGGVRRRFAPGRNHTLVQKQKAHFAKARAALQHSTSSQRSFRPDFVRRESRSANTSKYDERRQSRNGSLVQRASGARAEVQGRIKRAPTNSRLIDGGSSRRQNKYETRTQPEAPSVIYIESDRSSSSSKSGISHRSKITKQSARVQLDAQSTKTEEERLLEANRRRLLARTDWLGLAATRPLQMSFPSSESKSKIGKRRKIRRRAQPAQPADGLFRVPAIGERIFEDRAMMSGALQPNDILVKIGTDALVSQTQHSRHSRTPGQTSTRQPSTEFGLLSEESMLLGEDGDHFEADNIHIDQTTRAKAKQTDAISTAAVAGSQMTRNVQHIPESANMQFCTTYWNNGCQDRFPHDDPIVVTKFSDAHRTVDVEFQQSAAHARRWNHDERDYQRKLSLESQGQHRATTPTQINLPDQDADDETWRHLMNILRYTSSQNSLKAMKSSSMHLTTSESSRHPLQEIETHVEPENDNIVSTPRGAGTQGSILHRAQELAMTNDETRSSGLLQSPSTSLRNIMKLAEQPAQPPHLAEEDANDNELWRQFVIGSQDSSEGSTHPNDTMLNRFDIDTTSLRPESPSNLAISGFGTSVKSTAGGTLFVTGKTSSEAPNVLSGEDAEIVSDEHQIFMIPSTSVEAHATTVNNDQESIEDEQLVPTRPRQTGNIHSAAKTILNSKRFKPPKREKRASAPKPNRFKPPRTKTTTPRAEHSLYDLVDSDGRSLA